MRHWPSSDATNGGILTWGRSCASELSPRWAQSRDKSGRLYSMTRRNRFQGTQISRRERTIPLSLARSHQRVLHQCKRSLPWSSRNSPVPHVRANFVPCDAKGHYSGPYLSIPGASRECLWGRPLTERASLIMRKEDTGLFQYESEALHPTPYALQAHWRWRLGGVSDLG